MAKAKNFKEVICDYNDTVFAILGFMNFYRYDDDTRKMRQDVKVFQGRRLHHIEEIEQENNGKQRTVTQVTPDIGVVYNATDGILAEVKRSFCRNQDHWMDDFRQLLSYDGMIEAWPTPNGKLDNHEIALLVHQARGRAVLDYYQGKKESEIVFQKPFTIIEFNRSDEANPFFFFRTSEGTLRDPVLNTRLRIGVQVPMEKLSKIYSEIKLYDTEPPCPYLLEIIWTNVILPLAIKDDRFPQLTSKGKMEVQVEVDHIVKVLHENFSFKKLHGDEEAQPRIPQREWVLRGLDILEKAKEGKWVDRENGIFSVTFRKHKKVLEHFIEICDLNCSDLAEAEQTEMLIDGMQNDACGSEEF